MDGISDFQKLVADRIEKEGGACRDSLFTVYAGQGATALRNIALGLSETRLRSEFNNFAELGNNLGDGEEGNCRALIQNDLVQTMKGLDLDTLQDKLSRSEIEPILLKISRVSFWIVTWRNWKKANQFDKAA